MKIIDTHTHLGEEYYSDTFSVIENAKKKGVETIIMSCCDVQGQLEAINLLKEHDGLYLSVGLHPSEVMNHTDKDLENIENILKNDKVVAIGEIGLDFYWSKEFEKEQIDLFEKQLKIAEKYNLPVVIHSREATELTINILKKYNLKGIIHCFSGSLETAQEYIKMGYLLGIGGVVTFKNSKLKDVVKEIGLEHIVLETDAPYLAPDPLRGKKNEPKYLIHVVKFLSELFETTQDEVARITTENAERLFKL